MKKNIKDYLHLYLGNECYYEVVNTSQNRMPIQGGRTALSDYELTEHLDGRMIVKPLLRPLSDILNTEAHEVYKRYFDKEMAEDWSKDTGSVYFNPTQVRVKAEHAIRIFNGQDYETGDFMKVISLVPYLLKQGFDLFGLIESGMAIDKTTIK